MRPVKKRKDWRRNRELPEKREPREMRSGLLGEKRTLTHAFTLINFSVVTFTTASKYTKSNEVFMMLRCPVYMRIAGGLQWCRNCSG